MRAAGVCGRGENGKDMQMREAAFVDEIERALKHVFGFSREADDEVSSEDNVRARCANVLAKSYGVDARVTPLHTL